MKLIYNNGTLIYVQVKPSAKNQEVQPIEYAKTSVDKAILHKEKNKINLQFAETAKYIGGTIDGCLYPNSKFKGNVSYEDDQVQPLEGRYYSNETGLVIKGRFVGRKNSHFILELNGSN